MSLEARNNRAMAAGQAAWDNREPDDDDGGRSDFIEAQVELLMSGDDARDVTQDEYLEALDEALADCECGSAAEIILAVMNREFNLASTMAGKMAGKFEAIAVKLIEREIYK